MTAMVDGGFLVRRIDIKHSCGTTTLLAKIVIKSDTSRRAIVQMFAVGTVTRTSVPYLS